MLIFLTAKCQELFRKLPSLSSFHITLCPRPFACQGAPRHISMTAYPTKASSQKCRLVLLHRSTVPFHQPIVWAHTKEALMGGTPSRGICVWMVFFCCFKWVWGAFQSYSFTNTKGPKPVSWLFSESSLKWLSSPINSQHPFLVAQRSPKTWLGSTALMSTDTREHHTHALTL